MLGHLLNLFFLLTSCYATGCHYLVYADNSESKSFCRSKFGKDPTVETSFLPDRCGICSPFSLSFSAHTCFVLGANVRA